MEQALFDVFKITNRKMMDCPVPDVWLRKRKKPRRTLRFRPDQFILADVKKTTTKPWKCDHSPQHLAWLAANRWVKRPMRLPRPRISRPTFALFSMRRALFQHFPQDIVGIILQLVAQQNLTRIEHQHWQKKNNHRRKKKKKNYKKRKFI